MKIMVMMIMIMIPGVHVVDDEVLQPGEEEGDQLGDGGSLDQSELGIVTRSPPITAHLESTFHSSFLFSIFLSPPPGLWVWLSRDLILD